MIKILVLAASLLGGAYYLFAVRPELVCSDAAAEVEEDQQPSRRLERGHVVLHSRTGKPLLQAPVHKLPTIQESSSSNSED